MKDINKEHIKMLMLKQISKEQFLELEGVDEDNIEEELYEILSTSFDEKDAIKADRSIYLIFAYKIFKERFIESLNKLILCDWHKQHENIAMILQKIKSPKSVEVLFSTARKRYKYLEYDESFALAVKCIWGLGDIGTKDAYEKLKILSESDNEIIVQNAIKQLDRIDKRNIV